MAAVILIRNLQKNCTRSIFVNFRACEFSQPRKSAFQTLASSFILNKWGPQLNNRIDAIQKSNLSLSPLKASAPEDYKSHDHVKHWSAEKVLTVAMLGTIPSAVMYPSAGLEYFLALQLALHVHWGIEAVVVDYIRPSLFGNTIPKLSIYAVYGLSALTLGGLFYFIYTDVGLINAVKLLWKL